MLLYRLMVDAFTQPAGRFARAMYHVDPAVDVRILEVGGSTIVEAGMGLQP
jgi:hypothetical protein